MIASWMLYTLLVSLGAALAAIALDAAGRALRLPTRQVWVAGMAACVALGAAGVWRAAVSRPALAAAQQADVAIPRTTASLPDASAAAALLASAREGFVRAAASVAAVGNGAGFWVLAGGWAALTALLLAVSLLTLRRFRRGRRGWPSVPVAGIPVRVAPAAGPAVVGLLHPEIVVPAWLLGEPAEHQRMVVLHEDEHIRGRDPLLAGACFALAALMPWNPVMWWLLRRMRWAAEVDCDRRVLRHDVPTRAYGSLLIEMAGRTPRLSLGVSPLSESSAALKRRLHAMTARMPRWPRTRALALGALSALALVGACEARMPTAAEIEALDARHVEAVFSDGRNGNVVFTVDGREVTAEEARAIAAESIVRVDVRKGDAGVNQVAIITRASASAGNVRQVSVRTEAESDPIVIIDGVRSDAAALRALRTDQIATVEVIKGAEARRLYDEPQAEQGVIRITTKAGRR
ncbi:MAG: M56 family metallopeptidase [Longimicrobiaceae bacterium]